MKLVCIFSDGQGRLLVETATAPNLRRRDLAAATGGAEIVYCAIPPRDIPLNDCLTRLSDRLGSRIATCEAELRKVRWIATQELVVLPVIRRIKRRIRRRIVCTQKAIQDAASLS